MLKEKYILLTKNLCFSQKKAVILHVGEGEDSPTQSLAYRDMNTENKDKKDLEVIVELLDKDWNQVWDNLPDDPEEITAEQMLSYSIAMQVIDKIERQIQHYLITGEKKDIEIQIDKEGWMYD